VKEEKKGDDSALDADSKVSSDWREVEVRYHFVILAWMGSIGSHWGAPVTRPIILTTILLPEHQRA
jgi:hypothetical protein